MSAPPSGSRPSAPHHANMTETELAHQIAATCACGAMSALSAQLPASALDPTFADPALQKLMLVGVGAYKTFYAFLLGALKDPAWATPEGIAAAPVPAPPPATPAAPAGLASLISAVSGGGS